MASFVVGWLVGLSGNNHKTMMREQNVLTELRPAKEDGLSFPPPRMKANAVGTLHQR